MNDIEKIKEINNVITKHYDTQLEQIENITWMPCIGLEYQKREKKVFIVGHSYRLTGTDHGEPYPRPEDDWPREFHQSFINQFLKKENNKFNNFYLAITELLLQKDAAEITNKEFLTLWKSVAFTNFIQSEMGNPTQVTKGRSRKIIHQICEIIQPTYLVITSTEYARWMQVSRYVKEKNPTLLATYHPTGSRTKDKYLSILQKYQEEIQRWELGFG